MEECSQPSCLLILKKATWPWPSPPFHSLNGTWGLPGMWRAAPQVLVLQVYEPRVLAKHKPDPSPIRFSIQTEKTN